MLRTLLALVFIVIAVVGAYVAYVYYSTDGEPVKVKEVTLVVDPGKVTEEVTPITVKAVVFNGFHLGVNIVGGNLEIYFNDVKAADVALPSQAIKHGDNLVTALVDLDNESLKDIIYTHLSQDEKSKIQIKGDVTIALGPIKKTINLDITRDFETNAFPSEIMLDKEYSVPGGKVRVEKLELELAEVTRDYVAVNARLTVYNDTIEPLYIGDLAYNVEHVESGVVLAEGRVTERALIEPKASEIIPFTVKVDLASVKPVWVAHIKNMEESTVKVNLWISVDIGGKTIDLTKDAPITIERKIKTSIFEYETQE